LEAKDPNLFITPTTLREAKIMSAITVGILEDDKPQAKLMDGWLTEAGFRVFDCPTGEAFLAELKLQRPQILILDWHLPDCEGIDILLELRNQLLFTGPILFATARDAEEDIVRCLSNGADDYLVKPLRAAELLARVGAIWRRAGIERPTTVKLGPIELDCNNCRAYISGEEVTLTATEFKLAVCMFSNVDRLLSREFLLREVWGVDAELDTRTVDMHVSRLRKLLKIGPDMGFCIKTIYRHGYRVQGL